LVAKGEAVVAGPGVGVSGVTINTTLYEFVISF
jgi:hypothetical protein